MSDTAYLALMLDGPLQSWGFASRFQRRTTGLHPTKSAVIGLIAAALGLAKGSAEERELLPRLAKLNMTSIAIQRQAPAAGGSPLSPLRLEDFHTTGGGYDKNTQSQFIPRKASGGPCDNPTVSRRQYLLEARFGVILEGPPALLERAEAGLRDPVWGVWLGRKSCIPAQPLLRGLFATRTEAERALVEDIPLETLTRVEEVADFDAGTDSLNDQPVSFGRAGSSAEGRTYSVRRVRLMPARIPQV